MIAVRGVQTMNGTSFTENYYSLRTRMRPSGSDGPPCNFLPFIQKNHRAGESLPSPIRIWSYERGNKSTARGCAGGSSWNNGLFSSVFFIFHFCFRLVHSLPASALFMSVWQWRRGNDFLPTHSYFELTSASQFEISELSDIISSAKLERIQFPIGAEEANK